MTAIGEPIIRTINITDGSTATFRADAGEKWKVTTVYATKNGYTWNENLAVRPETGSSSSNQSGVSSETTGVPIIGGNTSFGSSDHSGLQPQYINDSIGLKLTNSNSGDTMSVAIQAVRVA